MPESPELAEFKTSVSIVIVLVNVYVILLSPSVSHFRQRTHIEGLSIAVGLGKTRFQLPRAGTYENNIILLSEVEVARTTRTE